MKKVLLIFILFIVTAAPSFAQKLEVGIFGGVTNYQGDLAPVAFTIRDFKPATGVLLRYNYNRFLTLRLGGTYGAISGNDGKTNIEWRKVRNLSFYTHIAELALISEIHLFGYEDCGGKSFSPYVFFGLAVYNFNPKTFYQGQWVELQPLGTEGQGTSIYPDREKYKLTQLSVPFGAGIKLRLSRAVNLSAEVGWRKTFTDYLDDVSRTYVDKDILQSESGILSYNLSNRSGEYLGVQALRKHDEQRGDPTEMDWYLYSGIILSYTFGKPCYNRSGVGCPKI